MESGILTELSQRIESFEYTIQKVLKKLQKVVDNPVQM